MRGRNLHAEEARQLVCCVDNERLLLGHVQGSSGKVRAWLGADSVLYRPKKARVFTSHDGSEPFGSIMRIKDWQAGIQSFFNSPGAWAQFQKAREVEKLDRLRTMLTEKLLPGHLPTQDLRGNFFKSGTPRAVVLGTKRAGDELTKAVSANNPHLGRY